MFPLQHMHKQPKKGKHTFTFCTEIPNSAIRKSEASMVKKWPTNVPADPHQPFLKRCNTAKVNSNIWKEKPIHIRKNDYNIIINIIIISYSNIIIISYSKWWWREKMWQSPTAVQRLWPTSKWKKKKQEKYAGENLCLSFKYAYTSVLNTENMLFLI